MSTHSTHGLREDHHPDKLEDALSKVVSQGVKVSQVIWHSIFARKTSLAVEAGEWETWLIEMASTPSEIDKAELVSIRKTCCLKAISHIMEASPDTRHQCQEAWAAAGGLIGKMLGTDWCTSDVMGEPFCGELKAVQSLLTVGEKMHYSSQTDIGDAEASLRKLQTKNNNMVFGKILTASAAGAQLAAACSEVTAALKECAGWKDDLDAAMDAFSTLPSPLGQTMDFLSNQFEVTIPQGAKIAEVTSKLGTLLQKSTDKFQADNKDAMDKLKELQSNLFFKLKTALSMRLFSKVPTLADAFAWCTSGCSSNDEEAKNHTNALVLAKAAVVVKFQFSKFIGADHATALGEYMAEYGRFITAMTTFSKWILDANQAEKAEDLSVFQAEALIDMVKYLLDATAGQSSDMKHFDMTQIHPNAPQWKKDVKAWLASWSQSRIERKLASCQDFVGAVLQEDFDPEKLCVEHVTGAVDAEEDHSTVKAVYQEFSSVSCTLCFDETMLKEFKFGEVMVDMQTLCAASIFLPAARYTTALLQSAARVSLRKPIAKTFGEATTIDQLKQPSESRAESAKGFLNQTTKWLEASILVSQSHSLSHSHTVVPYKQHQTAHTAHKCKQDHTLGIFGLPFFGEKRL